MKTFLLCFLCLLTIAIKDCHGGEPREREREIGRNYILRRQQVGAVRGVPTTRRIVGKREIDVYRNGLMFERDHVIGVTR